MNSQSETVSRTLADSKTNKFKIGICVSLIVIIIVSYIIAIVAIQRTFTYFSEDMNCSSSAPNPEIYCTLVPDSLKWEGKLNDLTSYNGLINFWAFIRLNNALAGDERIEYNVPYTYVILGEDGESISETTEGIFKCNGGDRYCRDKLLFIQPSVSSSFYKYSITFNPPVELKSKISSILLSVYMLNEEFTRSMLSLRYILFAFSIITTALFTVRYLQTPVDERAFEVRYIFVAGFLLILFNDPFFAISFLNGSKFFSVLSTLFATFFLGYLVFFWGIVLLKIKEFPYSFKNGVVTVYRFLPGIAVFILSFVAGVITLFHEIFQPAVTTNKKMPPGYVAVGILTALVAVSLIVGLIWLLIGIGKVQSPILSRYYIFMIVSVYFIFIAFIFFLATFYHPFDTDGTKVALIFLLFNFYIYWLQILWGIKGFKGEPSVIQNGILENLNSSKVLNNSNEFNSINKNEYYNKDNSYQLDPVDDPSDFNSKNEKDFSGRINFAQMSKVNQDPYSNKSNDLSLVKEEDDSRTKNDITVGDYEEFDDQEENQPNLKMN